MASVPRAVGDLLEQSETGLPSLVGGGESHYAAHIKACTTEGHGCQDAVGLTDLPQERTLGSLPDNLFAVFLLDLHFCICSFSKEVSMLSVPHTVFSGSCVFISYVKLRMGVAGARLPGSGSKKPFLVPVN